MGDVFVMDSTAERTTKLTDVESRAARPRARRAEARQVALVRRHGDLGPAADAAGRRAGRQAPARSSTVHGGPGGGVTYGLFPQFMHIVPQVDPYPTEAMASAGIAVLFPMPRGGAGYGEAGQRAIIERLGRSATTRTS